GTEGEAVSRPRGRGWLSDGRLRTTLMAYDYVHLDPNLPPEVALEAENLQRRQRIAEMLLQRSIHPLQPTQTGRFTAAPGWGQGLSQIGQALIGGYTQRGERRR